MGGSDASRLRKWNVAGAPLTDGPHEVSLCNLICLWSNQLVYKYHSVMRFHCTPLSSSFLSVTHTHTQIQLYRKPPNDPDAALFQQPRSFHPILYFPIYFSTFLLLCFLSLFNRSERRKWRLVSWARAQFARLLLVPVESSHNPAV